MSNQIMRPMQLAPEPVTSEMSLLSLVEPLFRYLKLFLIVAGAVLAVAFWWIFSTPRRYESHASILVQNARSNVLISPGNSNGPTVVRDITPEQLNSELEVLTSKDLLDEVVSPNWNANSSEKHSQQEIKAHEAAIASLSRRLDASIARQSHVLLIKITAPSPEDAQAQTQRLIAAFMARQRQISRPPGATRFFADQAERYRRELADAQRAMADFQKQRKLVNITDREAALSNKLVTADNLRRDAEVQISDLEKRIQVDTASMSSLPSRQRSQERTVPLSGALDQLTMQLVTLKNKRTELLNQYQPTDRMVKEVEAQIAETEAGIRGATFTKSQDLSTDINPTWQAVQTDVTMMRAQLNGLVAKRQVLSKQMADTQTELNSIEGLSPDYSALQRKVIELDNNYQTFLQKRDEAEIADSMDRQDLVNFAVIQSPTYSTSPVHPKPLRDTFLGFITACLMGGIAVFLRESVRDTVGTAAELERVSHFPALATIPWLPAGHRLVADSREESGTAASDKLEPLGVARLI